MKTIIKPVILPVLFAIYPALLHYANNVEIVKLDSLSRMILFNLLLSIVIYLIIFAFNKKRAHNSALAAFIFLIFFNTYGLLFNALIQQDRNVRHIYGLPLFILVAILATWLFIKVNNELSRNLWNIFTVIFFILSVFNVIRIVPSEVKKIDRRTTPAKQTPIEQSNGKNYPDIYYLVFDEFAGFESMRQYWKNTQVDEFVEYLSDRGFFVAEDSHSTDHTGDTMHQMAMRLNYQRYPNENNDHDIHYRAIANNKVMNYLKDQGYTTITFDDVRGPFGYEAKDPIQADINFEDDPEIIKINYLFDEYGTLVADNTMLLAFSQYYKAANPALKGHKNMIHFTANKLGELSDDNPIFVYVHLLFPHTPFMFDENGRSINQEFHENWDYYLGNYMYSVKIIQQIVDDLLLDADPDNPPVIILQSDHGARFGSSTPSEDEIHTDFPWKFKSLILNAIYLPQCENAILTHNMDPINTFPIIFNCLFNDQIPIQ